MEQTSSSTSSTQRRQLTSKRVQAILMACIIPNLGTNKLPVIGRGNPHRREDGTAVHIFNVQAFASTEDAQAAAASWKEGSALELAGDINGAQDLYKKALNQMMSFSVRSENADAFASTYEVLGKVEEVPTRAGGTTLGLNNVRPVQVETKGASTASMFELPDEIAAKPPVTETSAAKETQQAQRPALTGRKGK